MNPLDADLTDEEIMGSYQKYVGRKAIFILSSLIFLVLVVGLAGSLGQAKITIWEAYAAFFSRFLPDHITANWLAETTIWNLRLPRIALGTVTGAGLGVAGCIMQGVLKNPLASPYTLGISAGATFGASLAIIGGAGLVGGDYLIIGNAFFFSLLVSLSRAKGSHSGDNGSGRHSNLVYLFSSNHILAVFWRRIGCGPVSILVCGQSGESVLEQSIHLWRTSCSLHSSANAEILGPQYTHNRG